MTPQFLLVWTLPVLVLAENRGITGGPRTEIAALLLVTASLVAGGMLLPQVRTPSPRICGLLSSGLALLAWASPSPVREMAILSAFASLAALKWPRAVAAAWLGLGATTAGLVNWLTPWALAWCDLDAPVRAVGQALLFLLGCDTTSGPRSLFVHDCVLGPSELVPVSWTHSGARPLLSLCAGAIPLTLLFEPPGGRVRVAARFLAAAAGALLSQSALVAILSLELAAPEVPLDPSVRIMAMGAPLLAILCLERFVPSPFPGIDANPAVVASPSAVLGAAIGIGAVVVGVLGPAPSIAREGVVAFDVGHSFWERLDHSPEAGVYGPRSEYNYSDWESVLRARHGEVARIDSEISESALSGVSVLILKTPTVPYSATEVEAVRRWVLAGGGLLLVGDHTDIFGMNTHLNQVARNFGIEFRADATFELGIEGGQVTDTGGCLPHPVTDAMRPLHWMTSCTLRLTPPARPVLMSSLVYADEPDYGILTFFGNHALDPQEMAGSLVQAASVEVGEGRVFAFTDSTLLSGFSIYLPGVRELSVGAVSWLNRRPVLSGWGLLLVTLGLVVITARAVGAPWRAPELLTAIVLGAGIGLATSRLASMSTLSEIDREPLGVETVIDQTVSAGALPMWHESHSRGNEIWGLSVAFQRHGAWLRVAMEGENPFDGAACVLTWPKRPLPRGFVDRARRFVEAGGVLFVFDSHNYAGCATNEILEPLGLRMSEGAEGVSGLLADVRRVPATVQLSRASTVVGGTPIVRSPDGKALVAMAGVGRGVVVASGICEDFSSAAVGQSGAIDRDRKAVLLGLMHSVIEQGLRRRADVGE